MCRFFIFTDIAKRKEEIGKPGIYLVVYEATRLVNDEKAIDIGDIYRRLRQYAKQG